MSRKNMRRTQITFESDEVEIPNPIPADFFNLQFKNMFESLGFKLETAGNFGVVVHGFTFDLPMLRGAKVLESTETTFGLAYKEAPLYPLMSTERTSSNKAVKVSTLNNFVPQELSDDAGPEVAANQKFIYLEDFDLKIDAIKMREEFAGRTGKGLVTVDLTVYLRGVGV